MMKLLHERLREHGEESFLLFKGKGYSFTLWEGEAKALADEIEKYYIPRPRFEDGEPIKEGDVFIQKFSDEEDVITRVGVAMYGKDGFSTVWFTNETVQRPTPKVLDADGVEINVGDTVWHVKGSSSWKVILVDSRGVFVRDEVLPEGEGGSIFGGYDLTHKEPDTLEKEPDTLEKLRDDIRNSNHAANACAAMWDKRLTALIERGA